MTNFLKKFDEEILPKISGNTLVSTDRLRSIYLCLSARILRELDEININYSDINIDFNAAEVGVYKGGTAKLMLEQIKELSWCNLYLFDTFEGLPYDHPDFDLHKKGEFSDTSIDAVAGYLEAAKHKNLHITKGIFPDCADEKTKSLKFNFVHLDVDMYDAYLNCLDFFYSRMAEGGIIICDDYGFPSCPGAKKAIDLFFSDKDNKISLPDTNQAIIYF